MTHHLTPAEIIDVAEGARAEAAAPHLAVCDQCRRQLQDTRTALHAAAAADVPEPSPLFWDHFSARVAGAIASQPARARRRFLPSARWRSLRIAVPLAAAAMLVVSVAVWNVTSARRHIISPETGVVPRTVAERPGEPSPVDDPLLDLVADVGSEIDFDSAADAGLTAREGTVDKAVMQLTDVERAELQRLLQEELRRAGD